MTLLELAKQYESDVKTRISCIHDEWDEMDECLRDNEDACNDYDDQIAHWNATLQMIRAIIKENENPLDTITDNAFDLEDGKNG